MSTANKVLIHRWFEEVWNKKRESAIAEMIHPNALIYGLGDRPVRGAADLLPFWKQFTTAIPNLTVAVESTVAEDDRVAARCSVRGRHTGPGLGAPTGNAIAFSGMVLVHIRDGKFHEAWNSFDFLTLYQQIGLVALPK